jgi:hypothetical protein
MDQADLTCPHGGVNFLRWRGSLHRLGLACGSAGRAVGQHAGSAPTPPVSGSAPPHETLAVRDLVFRRGPTSS